MKKLLAMLLVLAMISCLFVACANNDSETDAPTAAPTEDTNTNESTDGNTDATEPDDNNGDVKIAMITDYGDITDQSAVIDGGYGEGMTLTSAMKGLAPTTIDTLTDVIVNGNWANYAGKIETLGLVSDTDPSANYVQLPLETTQWEDGKFTVEDYTALVADMFNGKVKVSNDTTVEPTVSNISVNYLGNIKG